MKDLTENYLNPTYILNESIKIEIKQEDEKEEQEEVGNAEAQEDYGSELDFLLPNYTEKSNNFQAANDSNQEDNSNCFFNHIDENEWDSESSKCNDDEDLLIYAPPIKRDYNSKCRQIGENAFECIDCGLVKKAKYILIRHIKKHDEKSMLCQYCGQICLDKSKHRALLRHEERCKELIQLGLVIEDNISYVRHEERICPHCNRISRSYITHMDHVNSHTGDRPNVCSCGKRFTSIYNLYAHRKQFGCSAKGCYSPYVDDIEIEDATERRKLSYQKRKFDTTTKSFGEVKERKRRSKNGGIGKNGPQPFRGICEICGKVCINKESFVRHKKLHLERRFVCEHCNCAFQTPVLVKEHIKKTHMEKIKCDICKTFVSLRRYETHKLRHTGDFAYKCSLCGAGFQSNFGLRWHLKTTHGNKNVTTKKKEKNFTCVLCKTTNPGVRGPRRHLTTAKHLDLEKKWKVKYKVDNFSCDKCSNTNKFETFLELCLHVHKRHHVYIYSKMCEVFKNLERQGVERNVESTSNDENKKDAAEVVESRIETEENSSEILRSHDNSSGLKTSIKTEKLEEYSDYENDNDSIGFKVKTEMGETYFIYEYHGDDSSLDDKNEVPDKSEFDTFSTDREEKSYQIPETSSSSYIKQINNARQYRKVKLAESDRSSIDVPEIPLHIIVETQFIEKEMLSENCLRTILDHELEVRKKFKSGQLLPANLRGELRKAANGGKIMSKASKTADRPDIIILSDDDDDDENNSNEATKSKNKSDSDDSSDVPKYVIQLDSSLASLLTDSPGTQFVLPSSIIEINGNPAVVSIKESGDTNNILNQVTTTNSPGLNSIVNIQNAGQMPIISRLQTTQIIKQPSSTTISPVIKSVTLDGGSTINVPVKDRIHTTQSTIPLQIQNSSGESVITNDPTSNSEFPIISSVVSQASNSLFHGQGQEQFAIQNNTLHTLPITSLPAIKEIISQGKIYAPTSTTCSTPQTNLQANITGTTNIGVRNLPQLLPKPAPQILTKRPQIRLASNLFIKDKASDMATTLNNRPFVVHEKRKFHDQIVQTMFTRETIESSNWPQRNRAIQCNLNPPQSSPTIIKPLQYSVGIQCELNDPKVQGTDFVEKYSDIEEISSFDKEKFKFFANGKWECLICGEVGTDSEEIASHHLQHMKKSTLCCYCGKLFTHMKDRKLHEIVTHKKRRPPKSRLQVCPYPSCDVIKRTIADLYDHINYHTGDVPHNCSCGKSFYSYNMLQWHRIKSKCAKQTSKYPYKALPKFERTHEQNIRKLYKKGKIVLAKYHREKVPKNVCKYCLKVFQNSVVLSEHTRKSHHGKYMCKICRNSIPIKYRKDHMKAEKLLAKEFQKSVLSVRC